MTNYNDAEVLPYTIDVTFEGYAKPHSFFAEAGRFQLDAYYLVDAHTGWVVAQVTGINTNSTDAVKQFIPYAKLLME